MVLKFILIASALIKCFLIPGTTSIVDPCPSNVHQKIAVATMCTNITAFEDRNDVSVTLNSVVLQIIEHQSDCVCDINIKYQVSSDVIYLRKYDDRATSAPSYAPCGLEIDVNNIYPNGQVEPLDPITCLTGYNNRSFNLSDKQILKMTSRKSNGTFKGGYCLQINRNSNIATPKTLTIKCFDPLAAMSTIETTKNQLSTHGQHSTESTNTNGKVNGDTPKMTTEDSSTNFEIATYGSVQTDPEIQTGSNEKNLKVYIISGSAAGGGIFIISVLVLVVCKCRQNSKYNDRASNKEPTVDNEDYDSYGLKDNVLYISSDGQETCIGYYSIVKLEASQSTAKHQMGLETTYVNSVREKEKHDDVVFETRKPKPELKPGPSKKNATFGREDETNFVEYAVVNRSPKVQVDHVTHANSNNEYAVVNKAWKT